jgi:ADP-ribose pyrophosphatase
MDKLKVLNSERRYAGRVFNLVLDEVELPSGRRTVKEIAEHAGGAVIVPMMEDRTLLLVRQYRHAVRQHVVELPAGKLGEGEDPAVCAARELEEETGYVAARLEKLTAIFTTPGFCSEQLHIYLATGLQKAAGGQKLEDGEFSLTVERIPLGDAVAMIRRREIVDGKTIAGILLTWLRLSGG